MEVCNENDLPEHPPRLPSDCPYLLERYSDLLPNDDPQTIKEHNFQCRRKTTVEDFNEDVEGITYERLPIDCPFLLVHIDDFPTSGPRSPSTNDSRKQQERHKWSTTSENDSQRVDVLEYENQLRDFATHLETYYLSKDEILAQVALSHNIDFDSSDASNVGDLIINHIMLGKCFSSPWPGHACRLSRLSFMSIKEFVHNFASIINDQSTNLKFLLAVCRVLGMTETELSVTHDSDDCKKYITIQTGHLTSCDDLESILVRCDDMSHTELLFTCRMHNLLTDDNRKKNMEAMRIRLVNHLCESSVSYANDGCDISVPLCCKTITKDASRLLKRVMDDLQGRISLRKSLRRVLNALGVAVAKNENIAEVKRKANLYLRKAKKFVSKAPTARSAKHREMKSSEKAAELERIRTTWPQKIGSDQKARLIQRFRHLTSTERIRLHACAVCGEGKRFAEFESQPIPIEELQLQPLAKPYPGKMPNPFANNPLLKEYILCPDGVIDANTTNPKLRICRLCNSSLSSKSTSTLPDLALANDLVTGETPECLKDLTMVERSFISLAQAGCSIIQLNGDGYEGTSLISQRGLRGHCIIYPTKPKCLAKILPPPIEDIVSPMCVVFVGSKNPTREWLLSKARPLIVRREVVRKALIWLTENNPLYKDVCINHEQLNSYDHTFICPVNITTIEPTDDINAQGSSHNGNLVPEGINALQGVDLPFDSAVVTDLEGRLITPQQMAISAMRHLKKGGGFVQVPHDSEPSNTYNDHEIFPKLFPDLFPFGVYGFERPDQPTKVTMRAHARHLLRLYDKRFQENPTFQFIVFNTLQLRDVNKNARFKINKDHFERFARDFDNVSIDDIDSVAKRLEGGKNKTPLTEQQKKVMQLMNKVMMVNTTVQGTSASRVRMRNRIRAMMMKLGMPSFYITINPADVYNPIIKFLAGDDIDLENLLKEQIPTYWDQAKRIAQNPVLASEFSHLSMDSFFKGILNYTLDHDPNEIGVLGLTKGYFGCVEAQGRGTLHCHLFVWLEGGLNPDEIKERVNEEEFTTRLCDYIDDTIKTQIPHLAPDQGHFLLHDSHPCATRGPPIVDAETYFESDECQSDLHKLAEACQKHSHTASCYKYWKGLGETKDCRYNLDSSIHVEKTTIDSETGEFTFRVTDGMVNNFCETILIAMRCNIDIKFIGSGQAAKAVLYYITDYITKTQLKTHTAYAALKTAVIKLRAEENEQQTDDFAVKARKLLIKCANSLISKQELSAPQVALYLMGHGDEYTSHAFKSLHVKPFQSFIENDLPASFTSAQDSQHETDDRTDTEPTSHPIDQRPLQSNDTDDVDDDKDEPGLSHDESFINSIGNGKIRLAQNDVTDYIYRSEEDEELNIWTFTSRYEKVTIRGDKSTDHIPQPHKKGRPFNKRSRFLPQHPESETHMLKERSHNHHYVPAPTCAIPNSEMPQNKEKHAMMMLTLFKPWRRGSDLVGQHTTWSTAFNEFLCHIADEDLRVIKNMQLLHQCKDARDKDFATKGALRRRLLRSLDSNKGERRAVECESNPLVLNDDELLDALAESRQSRTSGTAY